MYSFPLIKGYGTCIQTLKDPFDFLWCIFFFELVKVYDGDNSLGLHFAQNQCHVLVPLTQTGITSCELGKKQVAWPHAIKGGS